jgi:cob(I)alamin adenosyltransferase
MKKGSISTGKGDGGETRMLDGSMLPKDHVLIETLGSLDSFRSTLAWLRVRLQSLPEEKEQSDFLLFLIHACFALGAQLVPMPEGMTHTLPGLQSAHLQRLEAMERRLEEALTLPRAFIATASNEEAALADQAATAARTLERRLVACHRALPALDLSNALPFVNRMSDYLFILARHLEKGKHESVDYRLLDLP